MSFFRFSFWSKSSTTTTSEVDIEAQREQALQVASLPTLPARAHVATTSAIVSDGEDCTDAIDDFFGVTRSKEERLTPTRASRHDDPILTRVESSSSLEKDDEECTNAIDDFFGVVPPRRSTEKVEVASQLPPPYARDLETASVSLPSYSEASGSAASFEPYTIPEAFFKWGFIFPLFWPLGALLLINFHSPAELTAWYSPEESAERVRILRTAERRWAQRCALATVILVFVALVITGMVFGIMMSLKH
ncbi:hypothetical protein SCHPADRAFT_946716 [Schizopora paradoxa]|uniref:Uncharacterized protein n=1 Tax=Schizopora paradoxa TaxID=27342 RepID=A0A0H2R1Q6_9AGAM|nr:hypothetical protein SCHPADRAFT_946716 [Schizopora paradoxa]